MKSIKRCLSLLLAILIIAAMSAVTFTANAANQALIDTSQTGTLHVFKYKMSDTDQNEEDRKDTDGLEKTEDYFEQIGAKPIEGVEITITKIISLPDEKYYTADGIALPSITEARTLASTLTDNAITKTTGSNGEALFTGLSLGIYYVQETKSTNEANAIADFIVSVPTTNADEDGWNYNVYTYPKSATAYTCITLKKVDASNTNIPLEGAVFDLYKSDSTTFSDNKVDTITTDSNGLYEFNDLEYKCYYKLVETKAPVIEDPNNSGNKISYILDTDNNTKTFYVNDNGEACDVDTKKVINSANPKEIVIQNTKPTIEKSLAENSGKYHGDTLSFTKVKSNTYGVYTGDYKHTYIDFITPKINSMADLKTFEIIDPVPTGLTNFNVNSVKRQTNGELILEKGTKEEPKDYYVENTDGIVKVVLNTESENFLPNSRYTITFTASYDNTEIINKLGQAVINQAYVNYSPITNSDTTSAQAYSNEVDYHTSGLYFKKTNSSAAPLAGAEFALFKSLEDAQNYGKTDEDGKLIDNRIRFLNGDGTAVFSTVSDSNGDVKMFALPYGSPNETADTDSTTKYYLVEIKAPQGYSLLAEPVEIEVGKDSWKETNGMSITNALKTELPLTGGTGTLIFTIIGIVLIGGGVLTIFLTKKKIKNKGDKA